MYFQVIDDKKECVGHYADGQVLYTKPSSSLCRTWKYSASLEDRSNIEYANLLCQGKRLEDVCPDNLKHDLDDVNQKLSAFFKSISTSKIDLSEYCVYDLVPEKHVVKLLHVKDQITKHVFENYEKPKNYDFLLNASRLIDNISDGAINLDIANMKRESYSKKVRTLFKKLKKKTTFVNYNMFSTKTGRLTVSKNSFPILTLDKELRKYVLPNNDLFVELDINGAEIRTMLALLGKDQPQVDVHDWNLQNVYGGIGTREQAKKKFFAWLYNDNSEDVVTGRFYSRDEIKKRFWNGKSVTTPFHREIEADEYHAINYILQSTSSDVCLEQAVKVGNFLKDMKSRVAFLMHDSVILDYSAEEKQKLPEIVELFKSTRFGSYRTNVSIGKNFGEMRKLDWK